VAPPPAAAATAVVTPVVAEPTIVMPPIPEPTIVMPSLPAPALEIPRLAPPTIAMPPSAPAVKAKPKATPPAPAVVTEPSAPDEPVLRVAFDRVAAQLPPDVFVLPAERLSESLREPHTLVIPQRLVTPQLGEGVVEIPWTLIEDQFPDLALAVPRSEVHQRYPDWVFSLPMDEVVSQMPADLFHVATPPADLTEIDQFPAPFIEGLPAPEVEDIEPPLEVADAPPSASPPPVPAPTWIEPAPVPVVPMPAPAPSRPPLTQPLAVPVTSAASTATEPRDEQLAALGRSLAVTLAPVGALDWHARRIGGRPLVCFTGPGLDRVAIEALGIRGADLLEQLAPSSFEQVTVRSSRVACVLTPLAAGGALVAAVRRGGPTAWLEVLTARARGGAGRAPSLVARPSAAITTIGEGRGHARIGEAARALAVLGEVVPTEVAAEGGAPGVYLFARDADASLVSAARAVHDVLVAGHDEGALGRLDGVVLRRGPERVIVRPLRMPEGAPGLLVVAGDVTLTGQAQRAAALAATLLEAR